jgi:hypothetical protein
MSTFEYTDLKAALRDIAKHSRAREARVKASVKKAADRTASKVKREIAPKAFGFLADSIESVVRGDGAADVICESEYAEAMETGSRGQPRKMPPFDAIIAWVQLRGIQGITTKGNVISGSRAPRNITIQKRNTEAQAKRVGSLFDQFFDRSKVAMGAWRAQATTEGAVDAATRSVAAMIRHHIMRHGTKPKRFMLSAVPVAYDFLDYYVKQALTDNYVYV